MKPITIAIAGCGSRGLQAYAPGQALFPGRMRIVAAADIRPGQLALMRERYDLTQAQCYDSAESTITLAELAYYPRLCYASEDQALSRELFDLEDAYFPRMGLLTISDTGSFHNFLAQTPAYFIGIHTDSAYQATQFYKDIRVLDILGTDFSYDTIWVRRRGWSLTPLARTYLRRLYAVAGSEPDPILT